MKQLYFILPFVVLATALSAITPSVQEATDTLHTYLWANYKELEGNYAQASLWYNKLMNSQPPEHVHKGYITFLWSTGQVGNILSLMPSLEKRFADDVEIQLIFAQTLQKIGRTADAENRFLQLSNKFKHDQSVAFQAASIYTRRRELENALATIDNVLNGSPKKQNNFIFHFLKAQIYMQANQTDKALQSIKESLALHPRFDKGILLQALLEEQAGRLTQAMQGFATYLEITGTQDATIKQHLLQLTFKQKIAQEHINSAIINKTPFEKALYLFEHKDYPQALVHINLCLQKAQDIESKLLKIQILSALNHHMQAAEQLKLWIVQEPTNTALFDALHLLCRTNTIPYQKVINILEDIERQQPHNILPILHLADLNTRAHTYERALHYHNKALSLSTNDAQMQTKILFTMGLIYHEQGDYDGVERVLERALALNTNFPPLLNLLAYHYALHNKKLPEAQKLISLALQKNENNPHFLDTQALIYYAQKDYKKALALLESILPQAEHDGSIWHNLSKTQYQLGHTQKAITTMKKALQLAQHDHDKKACTSFLCQWETQK